MKNNRFARTEMLLGAEGMQKLKSAAVMIIGLGAVGGYCLEALARAGIGRFILVDFDSFEASNINRQILALSETLGQKKTAVAKARVLSINPAAVVETRDVFVNSETIDELLSCRPDYVIDAIDALNPKCDLLEKLAAGSIPFISSMGAALKSDPSKIRCGSLNASQNCSLARFIRKRLRKRGVGLRQIRCVWSDEQTELPQTALELPEALETTGRIRHTLGSLPTITAIFGLTIANQVILELSGCRRSSS